MYVPIETLDIIPSWDEYFSLWLDNNSENKERTLQVTRKNIESQVKFENDYNFKVIFIDCFFKEPIILNNLINNKNISFDGCIFNHSIVISGEIESKFNKLIFWECLGKIIIQNGNFKQFEFSSSKIGEIEIYITNAYFDNCNISCNGGAEITKLKINTKNVSGNIEVFGEGTHIESGQTISVGTKINEFEISGFSKNLTLLVSDIKVKRFLIKNYKSETGIRLVHIKATDSKSTFSIINAYLGKSELNSINFKSYETLEIKDSYLNDCSFMNITWPNIIQTKTIISLKLPITFSKLEIESNRAEIYKQIKNVYAKTGDKVNELKFHALEMQSFNKTLKFNFENTGKKLILYLSKFTSNFGQSLSRPVVSLIIGGLIIWLLLYCSNFYDEKFRFTIKDCNWDGFWIGLTSYIYILNPFRIYNLDNYTKGYILLDISIRIWSSYMIYNFIRASRRFIK